MYKSFSNGLLKSSINLSFQGADDDEESRKCSIFRARFLAALGMTPFRGVFQQPAKRGLKPRKATLWITALIMAGLALGGLKVTAGSAPPAPGQQASALLESFRHVEVASVSDAVEQITGRRMYMSHQMRPIFEGAKFTGFAVTVLLKKEEGHQGSAALSGMLAAIDQGPPDSVYVMVVQDGANIAGMGGLMGTAMAARDFAGAVIDGGTRDVAYLRKIRFPVFALGIVPSTSVNHYRFAGANIPVVCNGVPVHAGDVVVADTDGVVVVPREQAQQVLTLAQQMDFKEHSMYPMIEKYKSIEEAVKKYGRL